jgi:hypothetical protein
MSTNMVALVRHLNAIHKYCLRHEQHVFQNEEEYMEWYRKIVQDGAVSFVRSSGIKSNNEKMNNNISLMFYCNRSGKRNLNNRAGSIKMNSVCPSYFRMTKHQTGHVSVYAQLQHVGHECIPQFKSIDSYVPLNTAINQIGNLCKTFKQLSKTTIPKDYPMEKNSLVNSCMELLGNIKNDFERAQTLLDGIIPGGKNETVEDGHNDMKSGEFDDFYGALEDGSVDLDGSIQLQFSEPEGEDDDIQVLKESIHSNSASSSNETHNSQILLSPRRAMSSSPPTIPKLDAVQRYDEQRIQQYRQMPLVLNNGRIQCTLCSVILKNFESYNIHRHTQHGLSTIKKQPSPIEVAAGTIIQSFDSRKLCAVCHQRFLTASPNSVLLCKGCNVTFHIGCQQGHIAICPNNSPILL